MIIDQVSFSKNQFNKIFPFYFAIDRELNIVSMGSSLQKLIPQGKGMLKETMILKRPYLENFTFDTLLQLTDQLFVMEILLGNKITLKGQMEYFEQKDILVFLGSPWFGSMDQIQENNLTVKDFAIYDSIIDLLHVLRTQEIATEEIKILLRRVTDQKNQLKTSEEKYRNMVENATDIIFKANQNGIITYVNAVAERITGYYNQELINKNVFDLIRADYVHKAQMFYLDQLAQNTSHSYFECPLITKNGEEIWIGQSVQINKISAGNFEITSLAINITERKNAELNLKLQEEKYRNIIANINLGLLEVNLDDKILYANQSFCDMSGYTLQELYNKPAATLFMQKGELEFLQSQNLKREKGISDMYTIEVFNKNKEKKWWVVSGAPRYNDKGELVGSVGIHLDVTAQKLLEKELKEAKEKAEYSSKAKESFLATMSHEIRTPLNAIVGLTDLMATNMSQNIDENLNILNFSAKNLLSLISDVLDISKIDAGRIDLVKNTFDLKFLLNSIQLTFKPISEEKGVELVFDIDPDIPNFIKGDELRLSQILNNLMSNAVKFTSKGKVQVEAKQVALVNGKSTVNFRISDTGIGIRKNRLKTIFEAFEQADENIVRNYGGTGLGLNITKKLVQLHGSDIIVESRLNKGSSFYFKLEFEVAKNTTKLVLNQTKKERQPTNMAHSVLLVEDNIANQKVATAYLEHWGMHVTIANNGQEALDLLMKQEFKLVLLDWFMPVMDGFETIKHIRRIKKFRNLPIVALTASAETNLMDKAIWLGANSCLIKPFNAQQLQSALNKYLEEAEDQHIEVTSNKIIKDFKYINLQKIEEASLGNKEFIKDMIVLLLEQVPIEFANCQEAIANKNLTEFANAIHKLKNSLLTLGFNSQKASIVWLEKNARDNGNLIQITKKYEALHKVWEKAKVELKTCL